MNFNPSDLHPKFVEAMSALEFFSEEDRDSQVIADWVAQAMAYAPEPLQAMFRAKAREMGLLPDPAFYTEAGEPVYTTAQVATHLGISIEEANQHAQAIQEQHPDLAISAGSVIHRCQ